MTDTRMPAIPARLPEWVSVKQAARLANREPRTVYDWIDKDLLATRYERGVLQVLAKAAIRLGESTRRGRPKTRT
ncbi:hypothetical protein PQI51_03265 [Microbacterium esteraromaticum]|uniref:hypothetical protein n=1 Tax=Microbacterium esteraromaticum TaxID=57043 RepID=UPI0030A4213F